MAFRNIFLFAVFCLAYSNSGANANRLNQTLHRDFQLQYEVKNGTGSNSIIEFSLISNVQGWIAIGINENATMYGADVFMGGVNGTNNTYGGDYQVRYPARLPVRDSRQDWTIIGGYRAVNGTAILNTRRSLDTGDRANDTIIQNKPMYLLWSFNRDSHNVSLRHTERGSVRINLLTGSGPGIITPTPPTSTAKPPNTTKGASSTLSISFFGLAIGVLACFQRM